MSLLGKKTVRDAVMDLIFPRRCPFCGRITDGALLCPACAAALPVTGEHPTAEGTYGRCAAPLYYEGQVRDALLAFKFRGQMGGLDCFGEMLADCAAGSFPGEFDTVSWVPVSDKRKRERGFDQSYELCRAACRHWGVEPTAALRKVWDNPPQSGIAGDAQRRANVLGVYRAREAETLAGKRILLLDDVITTGATVGEAARVLLTAGAAEVYCGAVAMVRRSGK